MPDCPICHHYYFPPELAAKIGRPPHVCPPAWLVREQGDNPEDARRVYASDAEKAAHDFVQDRDAGTGYNDFTPRAHVLVAREPEDDEPAVWLAFRVTAKISVEYSVAPEVAP